MLFRSAGEEEEGLADPVVVTSGVEVAAPEEEPTGADPAAVVELSVSTAEDDSTALELSLADAVGVAEAVVSAGAELGALVSEALALEEALVSMGGIEIGWPAEEHWLTTALETETWSLWSQDFATQGVMLETSSVFWQWHLKSSSSEQPSPCRAVRKQLSEQAGTSGSWALARPAATRAIRVVENFILMIWTKK